MRWKFEPLTRSDFSRIMRDNLLIVRTDVRSKDRVPVLMGMDSVGTMKRQDTSKRALKPNDHELHNSNGSTVLPYYRYVAGLGPGLGIGFPRFSVHVSGLARKAET